MRRIFILIIILQLLITATHISPASSSNKNNKTNKSSSTKIEKIKKDTENKNSNFTEELIKKIEKAEKIISKKFEDKISKDKKLKESKNIANVKIKDNENIQRTKIKEFTVKTDNLNIEINDLSKKIKKEEISENDISRMKISVKELKKENEDFLNTIDKNREKEINKQLKIINDSEKRIEFLINNIENKYSGKMPKEELSKNITDINKEVDKINRQYRAIHWILFEQ